MLKAELHLGPYDQEAKRKPRRWPWALAALLLLAGGAWKMGYLAALSSLF